MKKIYVGIVSIVAVLAIVGASAYALFSDSVSMTGMVLGTATPGLLISVDSSNYFESVSNSYIVSLLGRPLFAPLLPGQMDWGEFWLENTSNGTSDKLNMNLAARITSASGDWSVLKDAIQMRVCLYNDTPASHCDEYAATGWHTLAFWNTNDVALPPTSLSQDTPTHYAIGFQIDSSFGNSISGKQITDMNFVATGTQVP